MQKSRLPCTSLMLEAANLQVSPMLHQVIEHEHESCPMQLKLRLERCTGANSNDLATLTPLSKTKGSGLSSFSAAALALDTASPRGTFLDC